MKKYVILSMINIVLVLFQLSFFPKLVGNALAPNLVLAFAFTFLLYGGLGFALFTAFFGGLLVDLLSFSHIGVSPLILCLLLMLTKIVRKHLIRNDSFFGAFVYLSFVLYAILVQFPKFEFGPGLLMNSLASTVVFLIFSSAVGKYMKRRV